MVDRRLLYLVSTARYGSFTAAAERVGVTQSAITKSVAELERELGYPIFNRTARGVFLTDEGRGFVERAARILDDIHDLFRGTSSGADPYEGTLRIGVCPASLEWLLVEPLTTLMARHPTIQLDITGGSFDKIVQQLRSSAIDIAVGYDAAFETQADFRRDSLPPLQTTFFVRKGHPILELGDVTMADIAKYDLISPSGSPPYDLVWQKFYEHAGAEAHGRLHSVDYFPIVARLVRNSDAVSLAALEYTRTPNFQNHFACLPHHNLLPPSPICCATRSRWSLRPAARAFIQACRERFPSEGRGEMRKLAGGRNRRI